MWESIASLMALLLVVWILYKIKVFLAASYFADAAVIAADDFASKVAHKSAVNAVKYEIEPDTFRKAMASKARNRAFRQSMAEASTNYTKWEEEV